MWNQTATAAAAARTILRIGLITAMTAVGVASLIGCARPTTQRIRAFGLEAVYDSSIDRLIYVGPKRRPNLLQVYEPGAGEGGSADAEGGGYPGDGGFYSWVSPQADWTDDLGEAREWPPEATMDRGPSRVTHHSLGAVAAVGPDLPAGLRESRSFAIRSDREIVVRHQLKNISDQPITAGVWTINAVRKRAVIAVAKPSYADVRFEHEGSQRLWDAITVESGDWLTISTRRVHWWRAEGGGALQAQIPSLGRVAVWTRGYWFMRLGFPFDEQGTLWAHGRAPIEIELDYASKHYAVHLLGPLVTLQPGESTEFIERWIIVRSQSADTSVLDQALASLGPLLLDGGSALADDMFVDSPIAEAAGANESDASDEDEVDSSPVESDSEAPEVGDGDQGVGAEPALEVDEPARLPVKPGGPPKR